MSRMFASASYFLTSANLSGWDTSSVPNMNTMFGDCGKLKTIRMKGCSEETINKIKRAMPSDCTIVTD